MPSKLLALGVIAALVGAQFAPSRVVPPSVKRDTALLAAENRAKLAWDVLIACSNGHMIAIDRKIFWCDTYNFRSLHDSKIRPTFVVYRRP